MFDRLVDFREWPGWDWLVIVQLVLMVVSLGTLAVSAVRGRIGAYIQGIVNDSAELAVKKAIKSQLADIRRELLRAADARPKGKGDAGAS